MSSNQICVSSKLGNTARYSVKQKRFSGHRGVLYACVMSALSPKADMCSATRDVRFGPEADISHTAIAMSLYLRKGTDLRFGYQRRVSWPPPLTNSR
jgi:hypothetical protein